MSVDPVSARLSEYVKDARRSGLENRVSPAKTMDDSVADFIAGGRIIAFHANFARIVGGAIPALLLSQFWYWTNQYGVENREGWFWKTQLDIEAETGLTRWEQETARKQLRSLGILREQKRGVPAKLWYQVDKDQFFALVRDYLTKPLTVQE